MGQVQGKGGGAAGGPAGTGGAGGTATGAPGNPVADPPVGVNPANQVNPSPLPGDQHFNFPALLARGQMLRPIMQQRFEALLQERYDLADRPSAATMTRGKPLQAGARAKLPAGTTWETLGELSADQIRSSDLFPAGFLPLPHPNQDEGGMVLPQSTIDEIKRQTGRDMQRFDLDFDIPDRFLAEFPPAIFLTTRPDLGDVSQGKVVTFANFFELFKGILTPKQLDGLRLLLTPFPQQQFNLTDDRRTVEPDQGIGCLECHVNGHTNGATHLVQDIRPQDLRNRIDTPSLRGTNIQRLFGSQRALMTVEDFTEFCHAPPHYTDLTMHDLRVERFSTARKINSLMTKPDGPIKTFPLRGIKDSPPYFHDGRLLTLEDTIEFFNIVLQTRLTTAEKSDLLAFLLAL